MKSVLNPEAPEFHPHVVTTVQSGFSLTNQANNESNAFPRGPAFGIYNTYDCFGRVTTRLIAHIVLQSNQIVGVELAGVQLQSHNIDENNTDKVIDVTDCLLDRVNINMDTLSGVNKPCEEFMNNTARANVSSWNNSPRVVEIKAGPATFLGGQNIPRPQQYFKDTVDNSYGLWVPKIFEKPNNIKPLALNKIYNKNGMAVGYEHPYSVELDLYRPPTHFIEPDSELPECPPPLDKTTLTHVYTVETLDALVKHLQDCEEIAIDTEHHSYRTYQGITCVIQITTNRGGDFIIDTLAIREYVYKLNHSFTDPKKIKILHGAASDVKWLQRDFGVYIVGMFDTYEAAKILQLPFLALKDLLSRYCKLDIDKKYQLADWRIRPLPQELINYARQDTHYLLYVWRMMKRELLEKNDGLPNLLLSVFENSRQTCCATYTKEVMDDVCHMPLLMNSKKTFNTQQMAALKILYKYRDAEARQMDESVSYLIPNHMLLSLAESLPRELQGVVAICSPMPPFIKMNLPSIHRMILSCRELPVFSHNMFEAPPPTEVRSGLQMPSMAGNITGLQSTAMPPPTSMLSTAMMMPPTFVLPPHLNHNVHDIAYHTVPTDQTNTDKACEFMNGRYTRQYSNIQFNVPPEVPSFALNANHGCGVESSQNVHGNSERGEFIPPYDRYRFYRGLAQERELKAIKDSEAKVTALSVGNELIKSEVLVQIQQQRDAAEADAKNISEPTHQAEKDTDLEEDIKNKEIEENGNTKQRKRKMKKNQLSGTQKKPEPTVSDPKVKPYPYNQKNYKTFQTQSEKAKKDN